MKKTNLFNKHLKKQRNINMFTSQVGPDDHPRQPKSPQGPRWTPPRHPQKTWCVFGTSWALPEEPPGPPPRQPRDPPRTPRDPPELSRRPPREPRGDPTQPSDLQGPPNDAQGSPGNPQHPTGTAPSIRPGGMCEAIENNIIYYDMIWYDIFGPRYVRVPPRLMCGSQSVLCPGFSLCCVAAWGPLFCQIFVCRKRAARASWGTLIPHIWKVCCSKRGDSWA